MEIDLAKPFILFAGDNGTGKTYVSTFLYCLVRNFTLYLVNDYFVDKKLPISKQLKNGWKGSLDAAELYTIFENYLSTRNKEVIRTMNLNIQERTFKCEIVTTKQEWEKELKEKSTIGIHPDRLSFEKKINSFEYSINCTNKDERLTQTVFLVPLYFDGVRIEYFLPAERNGIYTFSKEVSIGRLRNPDKLADNRYPLPISDGLAEAEDMANRKKRLSPYHTLSDDIEQEILHGRLLVSNEGEIQFEINGNKHLGINESSSAIKTLAPIVFYLRHDSGDANLLFIDEPELNLHPKNQILLAKIFVKMINAGLRLVISTHSDYIIREINNMIMADALTKVGSDLPEKQGYDKSLCLSRDKFSPYLFEVGKRGKVTVKPIEVDRYGFSMPSIDETINRQNEVTDTFYEILKYGYPNK